MQKFDHLEKGNLVPVLLELSRTNYYNDRHKIVRVQYRGRLFDFPLEPTHYVPNPEIHLALVFVQDVVLEGFGIPEERENLLPGLANREGVIAEMPLARAFLVDRKQSVAGANHQNASAAFNMNSSDLSDLKGLRLSLNPQRSKDYTSVEREDGDPQNENIGIFFNDRTILIKSRGGSITVGQDGVHIGGNVFWEHTKHSKEFMSDNPFHGFIPQTIVTFPISIPYIPNLNAIARMAESGQKVISIVNKTAAISTITGGS